jgi:hypothetical protein
VLAQAVGLVALAQLHHGHSAVFMSGSPCSAAWAWPAACGAAFLPPPSYQRRASAGRFSACASLAGAHPHLALEGQWRAASSGLASTSLQQLGATRAAVHETRHRQEGVGGVNFTSSDARRAVLQRGVVRRRQQRQRLVR